MPLDTEVDLDPGHVVLDVDPAPRAVATFEATEAAASVVFRTVASGKQYYFDHFYRATQLR